MLDRIRRTVTDDHVVVALLANHELEHARKGHEKGQIGVNLGRGIKSTASYVHAARRIGRPTPQRTPPGGMY